ncbi:MAG: signal peptidase II [Phycisphaerae bacterium]|nr:signal peptidase II [Phycisphaerae bacterium]
MNDAQAGGQPNLRDGLDSKPAWRSPAAWATLLIVFVLGLGLDLWSKDWAFRTVAGAPVTLDYERIAGNPEYRLPYHEGMRVIPYDLLDFRLVLNHGAVFGIGQSKRPTFVLITIVAILVALSVFARWTRADSRLAHVALGLIVAGGLGNLWDRMTYGAVRDFLHMLPRWELPFGWRWPRNGTAEVFPWVFNIADVMLLSGMALLLIYLYGRERAMERAARAAAAAAAPNANATSPSQTS